MEWMGWITSNDKDDRKTMNIRRKLVINSNQTWSESHINNECNDGNDNDPESLGEGHSSHSQRNMTKWIQRK